MQSSSGKLNANCGNFFYIFFLRTISVMLYHEHGIRITLSPIKRPRKLELFIAFNIIVHLCTAKAVSIVDNSVADMELPLKLVVGIIGNATSLALYLSPMPTFWGIYKFKSTKEYSGLPYVITLFNCCLGLLYGSPFVKPHSTLLLTINTAGFALEAFYLASFLTFALPKTKVTTMRLTCALMMAFGLEVAVTIFAFHTHPVRQMVVGTIGVVLSIIMYASPFSVVRLVIKTKSVEFMPFLLSLFNFLNAIAWLAYSIVTRDIFIGVPNGIGSVLGMIQLIVYFIYRNSRVVSPASAELSETKQEDNVLVDVADEKKLAEKLNVDTLDLIIEDQVV